MTDMSGQANEETRDVRDWTRGRVGARMTGHVGDCARGRLGAKFIKEKSH